MTSSSERSDTGTVYDHLLETRPAMVRLPVLIFAPDGELPGGVPMAPVLEDHAGNRWIGVSWPSSTWIKHSSHTFGLLP